MRARGHVFLCVCTFKPRSSISGLRSLLTRDISFAVGQIHLERSLVGLDDHPES